MGPLGTVPAGRPVPATPPAHRPASPSANVFCTSWTGPDSARAGLAKDARGAKRQRLERNCGVMTIETHAE